MSEITNAAFAVERMKILAADIIDVARQMREKFPDEYEERERLGMLEHTANVFLEEEERTAR